MNIKKIAAGAATAGVLGLGGLGVGAGLAQADPHVPPPNPGHSDNGNGPSQWPPTVTGPGVNAGIPGNPLPPGQGFLPPPGHGGPSPQDRVSYPVPPAWVNVPVPPPVGAPPQPELPDWAADLHLPVVWNPDLNVWGVWDAPVGVFVRL